MSIFSIKEKALIILIIGALWFSVSYIKEDFVSPEEVAKYQKAAEQGDAEAQNKLGTLYCFGLSVPQSDMLAFKWYQKAAEQGHALAQYNLADLYYEGKGMPQNFREAYIWSSLAATNDSALGRKLRDRIIQDQLIPEVVAEAQAEARRRQKEIESRKQK